MPALLEQSLVFGLIGLAVGYLLVRAWRIRRGGGGCGHCTAAHCVAEPAHQDSLVQLQPQLQKRADSE